MTAELPPFWNRALPSADKFDFPFQSVCAMIARTQAEQASDILRRWFREVLGPECPKSDEDIVTVAHAKGYSAVNLIPRTGDTDTLALQLNGKTIRSIGLQKPFSHAQSNLPPHKYF